MSTTIQIEITKEQLEAIKDLIDDAESMIGGADNDEYWQNSINKFDEVLKQNKLAPRGYKDIKLKGFEC